MGNLALALTITCVLLSAPIWWKLYNDGERLTALLGVAFGIVVISVAIIAYIKPLHESMPKA
jgi:hypothetical protein